MRAGDTELSVSRLAAKAIEDSEYDDFEIKAERPMVDVVEIKVNAGLHLFQRIGFAAKAVDLGPARNSWSNLVALHIRVN